MVSDNILVAKLLLREAAKGYLISLKASHYSSCYIEAMEMTLRLLVDYTEAQGWTQVSRLTASHLEGYLVYLQQRPRWFGARDSRKVLVSASSVETHYRHLKTFFNWLVERGHVEKNPLDLIKHPRFEERVIRTVSEKEMLNLLQLVNPRHVRTEAEKFRTLRNYIGHAKGGNLSQRIKDHTREYAKDCIRRNAVYFRYMVVRAYATGERTLFKEYKAKHNNKIPLCNTRDPSLGH